MITSKELVHLILGLNSLSDNGEKLELSEIDKLLGEEAPILKWLNEKYGDSVDMSIFKPKDISQLDKYFYSTYNSVDYQKKYLIKNNGINLLIAYLLDGLSIISSDPNYFEQINS